MKSKWKVKNPPVKMTRYLEFYSKSLKTWIYFTDLESDDPHPMAFVTETEREEFADCQLRLRPDLHIRGVDVVVTTNKTKEYLHAESGSRSTVCAGRDQSVEHNRRTEPVVRSKVRNDQKRSPWWKVETPRGSVVVGWSDRDVYVCWNETTIRQSITKNEVHKGQSYVKARTFAKAVEYLTTLSHLFMLQTMHSDVSYGEEQNKMCLGCGVWEARSLDDNGRCALCYRAFNDRMSAKDKTPEPVPPTEVKFIGVDWGNILGRAVSNSIDELQAQDRTHRTQNPCGEIPLTDTHQEGIVLRQIPERNNPDEPLI